MLQIINIILGLLLLVTLIFLIKIRLNYKENKRELEYTKSRFVETLNGIGKEKGKFLNFLYLITCIIDEGYYCIILGKVYKEFQIKDKGSRALYRAIVSNDDKKIKRSNVYSDIYFKLPKHFTVDKGESLYIRKVDLIPIIHYTIETKDFDKGYKDIITNGLTVKQIENL